MMIWLLKCLELVAKNAHEILPQNTLSKSYHSSLVPPTFPNRPYRVSPQTDPKPNPKVSVTPTFTFDETEISDQLLGNPFLRIRISEFWKSVSLRFGNCLGDTVAIATLVVSSLVPSKIFFKQEVGYENKMQKYVVPALRQRKVLYSTNQKGILGHVPRADRKEDIRPNFRTPPHWN